MADKAKADVESDAVTSATFTRSAAAVDEKGEKDELTDHTVQTIHDNRL